MSSFTENRGRQNRPFLVNLPLIMVFVVLVLLAFWFIHSQNTPRYDPDAQPRAITPRGSLTETEQTNISLFENIAPSVVYITSIVSVRRPFSLSIYEIPEGTGSGFIWDREGHIITNFHVVEDAFYGKAKVKVRLADQSEYDAFIVGGDRASDLAVIQINAPEEKMVPIPIGSSSDLKVGQVVYAIGNPFGFDHSLTTGVVSALGRELRLNKDMKVSGLIQTDASINPGNSGGPLLDSASRLIGVNTAIYSPSGSSAGLGFAVPVDRVNSIVPQILRMGRTGRAGLGVSAFPSHITKRLARQYPEFKKGFIIMEVKKGSAAAAAGLQSARILGGQYIVGADIIIGVNDEAIETQDDLVQVLSEHKPGDRIKVTFIRDNKSYETSVTLQAVD